MGGRRGGERGRLRKRRMGRGRVRRTREEEIVQMKSKG